MINQISNLIGTLNASKLQTDNNAAYQTINGLIQQLQLLSNKVVELENRIKVLETP